MYVPPLESTRMFVCRQGADMSEHDDLIKRHAFQVEESLAGFSWACACGKNSSSELRSRADAQRDGERHVAQIAGLASRPASQPDREMGVLLRMAALGGRVEPEDLSDFGSHRELMPLFANLLRRDLIDIARPMYGDNQLLSAHGISLTHLGRTEAQRILSSATDIRVGREPTAGSGRALLTSLGNVDGKRRGRTAFMNSLYEATDGSTSRLEDAATVGASLGWSRGLTADVVQYLAGEGLVHRPSTGAVALTHAGVIEVEEFQAAPNRPTTHFSPTNIVNVYGDNIGQIQAGTTSSTQSQSPDGSRITDFLDALSAAITEARETPGVSAIEASIGVVRESLEADGPSAPMVRRLLPGLRDFAINLAASGAFLGLTEATTNLPPFA